MEIYSGYLNSGFDFEFRKITLDAVKNQIEILLEKEKLLKSECLLVFTGLSGSLIGFSIAEQMEIKFLFCRKEKDSSHSSHTLEGYIPECKAIIFLDDFISTGNTLKRVYKEIIQNEAFGDKNPKPEKIKFFGVMWQGKKSEKEVRKIEEFDFSGELINIKVKISGCLTAKQARIIYEDDD